ncbi:MAG: succinylglutamate desuccinylase/aspartoacylase family protein [Tunicatimonas sp.]
MNQNPAFSSRIISSFPTDGAKPRLVVFAGVHGNEPSGVLALQRVFEQLRTHQIPLSGQLVGVLGNVEALRQEVRYVNEDLNRLFLPSHIEQARAAPDEQAFETLELLNICDLVDSLETRTEDELFFVDCHTTSSASIPFISLNEGFPASLQLAQRVPVAAVIGAEKEIKGCLAEWLNKRGWTGFTYEAGQHQAAISVDNQEAIIWLALLHAGCISEAQARPYLDRARITLQQQGTQQQEVYRLRSAYRIGDDEAFRMEPGFRNLQLVRAGELLATSDGEPVVAQEDAYLLMPLYQPQGNFGFFLVQQTSHSANVG